MTAREKGKLTLAENQASPDKNRLMQKLSNEYKESNEGSGAPVRNETAVMRSNSSRHRIGIRNLAKYQLWKSVLDRLFGLLAIIILSPILILISVLIRLDSPGNPIFRQERIGKDGQSFFIYKFRTMYIEHDDSAYEAFLRSYVGGDTDYDTWKKVKENLKQNRVENVTRIGAILRKTNLDELPQFLNILKGDMSLVGPRPDIPFAVSMYQEHHRERFRVMPGMTGLWQVSERKKVTFEEQIRLDIEYIEKQSLLLDIKILLLTAQVIINGEGS